MSTFWLGIAGFGFSCFVLGMQCTLWLLGYHPLTGAPL